MNNGEVVISLENKLAKAKTKQEMALNNKKATLAKLEEYERSVFER